MVTFGSHVGNHQFQPFLSGVYAGVIFKSFFFKSLRLDCTVGSSWPCFVKDLASLGREAAEDDLGPIGRPEQGQTSSI